MKKIKSLVFLSLCCCSIWAQSIEKSELNKELERKSSIVFSGSFMHPQGEQSGYATGTMGYYSYPVSPGIGIYYQNQLLKNSYLLFGINYQECHVASTKFGTFRFRYSEPSISIYFKHYLIEGEKIGLFSMIGLSCGQMRSLICESHGHNYDWNDFNTSYLDKYSNKKLFNDLAFNAGISSPSIHFEIAPSLGYRIKDNWMGYYRSRFSYGLSINYQLIL